MFSSPGLGGQGREQTPGMSTLTRDCCREWLQTDQWRIDWQLALLLSALAGNRVPYLGWNRLLVFIWTIKYSRKQAAEGGIVKYLTTLTMAVGGGLLTFLPLLMVFSLEGHIYEHSLKILWVAQTPTDAQSWIPGMAKNIWESIRCKSSRHANIKSQRAIWET